MLNLGTPGSTGRVLAGWSGPRLRTRPLRTSPSSVVEDEVVVDEDDDEEEEEDEAGEEKEDAPVHDPHEEDCELQLGVRLSCEEN